MHSSNSRKTSSPDTICPAASCASLSARASSHPAGATVLREVSSIAGEYEDPVDCSSDNVAARDNRQIRPGLAVVPSDGLGSYSELVRGWIRQMRWHLGTYLRLAFVRAAVTTTPIGPPR